MHPNGPISERRYAALDRYLASAVTELLAPHLGPGGRLRGAKVAVRFDRGVAHLAGEVARPAQLRLVRDLIGRLGGVLAVWSRVRVAGRAPVILDLGCGDTTQYPENIGLDLRAAEAVNVRAARPAGTRCTPAATGPPSSPTSRRSARVSRGRTPGTWPGSSTDHRVHPVVVVRTTPAGGGAAPTVLENPDREDA